ncbi:MAG: preprotein translocase subunit SecG [Lentilactobacillus hilgardii]|uniref:Protein-export membrane protein SecG n=2 Tax=Lentilactobacillus hilgardii TaxID=1588 RepID=C0XMN7_LENH9|nr:preprotein translocase subunit SecG [Lentilactobacillus hilgardii]EEI18471.1 preprotein translocase, SecG subunit [Lentilactobacillus buchneri ATCC 11577]MCI1923328.1 preprotein translocase subunit SecG [Lentilactobacillus buchneri]RRG09405.1 MAG: preprotein translocase subunit SecG [Lactobacillus sp.]EEI23357.1 preprotein translocase, SecG subunit [Lentilactobacillus hilgardii DSM 20176 = ATCC 8290]EEI70348.1 preprotein translocase, SecG subunit [Lentilactobacillus hilgardii ATCC 27305]
MYNLLITLLLIDCVLITIAVLMQPSKTNDAMSALTGGADDLFAKQKPRGFEAFMQKTTVVLGIIFFVLSLGLVWLSSH